jgi:cytochrome bd-type quinol oxidase subunit 2
MAGMSEFWIEWNRTSKGARIAIVCLVALMVGICVCSTITYLLTGDYSDARWTFPTLIIFFLWKVVYPFYLGAAARRKGGSFGGWFIAAMFLGLIFVLFLYWINFRNKPDIIPNQSPVAEEPDSSLDPTLG